MGEHLHHHHHSGKNILIAFFLNASFAVIELIGGYYTNSVSIISDALHDFGDSLALLFSFFAEKIALKKADEKFTFGYRRFSILSALINGLILLTGSIFVIDEAVSRILSPEVVKPEGMLALAVLGIIVNAVAAYRLSKNDGLNSQMVMYHMLEDLLGWIAVLIVSVILLFKPWFILDSILSILIALIILRGVYKNLLKVGMIFLQKFPDDIEINKIKQKVLSLAPRRRCSSN
jgi:cobalt-zinc-cadmium efflux system protein